MPVGNAFTGTKVKKLKPDSVNTLRHNTFIQGKAKNSTMRFSMPGGNKAKKKVIDKLQGRS